MDTIQFDSGENWQIRFEKSLGRFDSRPKIVIRTALEGPNCDSGLRLGDSRKTLMVCCLITPTVCCMDWKCLRISKKRLLMCNVFQHDCLKEFFKDVTPDFYKCPKRKLEDTLRIRSRLGRPLLILHQFNMDSLNGKDCHFIKTRSLFWARVDLTDVVVEDVQSNTKFKLVAILNHGALEGVHCTATCKTGTRPAHCFINAFRLCFKSQLYVM